MAERPVYVPGKNSNSADVYMTSFIWNKGLAISQKKKNITALHDAFQQRFPDRKILEISSKSMQELGIKLSAFNLKKFVPELNTSVPLECIFQGGKVFNAGGPYLDLYTASPRDAKRDARLKNSGSLKNFYFNKETIPLTPKDAFYNWLYINALLENPELGDALMEYDAFTDIEFNPNKSINCQAKAAAVYVGLAKRNLLNECRDFHSFVSLL